MGFCDCLLPDPAALFRTSDGSATTCSTDPQQLSLKPSSLSLQLPLILFQSRADNDPYCFISRNVSNNRQWEASSWRASCSLSANKISSSGLPDSIPYEKRNFSSMFLPCFARARRRPLFRVNIVALQVELWRRANAPLQRCGRFYGPVD